MQSFPIGNLESSKTRAHEVRIRALSERPDSLAEQSPPEVERALFVERLRREAKRHDPERHPFNLRMLEGRLSSEDVRLWVMNTYYYESRVPSARALVLAKLEDAALRRRFLDATASTPYEEALAGWERLAEATGLERAAVRAGSGVLVGVRFACDAYTTFLREASATEAVVASLAEALTPELDARRLAAFGERYSWIEPSALGCMLEGLQRKQRAAALLEHSVMPASAEARDACVDAVIKKSQIVWHILDCIDAASRMKAM